MSKKNKPLKIVASIVDRKLEAVIRQIARVRNGENSSFTVKELESFKEELLAKING